MERMRAAIGHPTFCCIKRAILKKMKRALLRASLHHLSREPCKACRKVRKLFRIAQEHRDEEGGAERLLKLKDRYIGHTCKRAKGREYWIGYYRRKMRKYGYVDKRSRLEVHKLWASTIGVRRRDTHPADDGLRAGHGAARQLEQEVAEEAAFSSAEDNAEASGEERVVLAEEIVQAERGHWQEQVAEYAIRRGAEKDAAREIAPDEEEHVAAQEAQEVQASMHAPGAAWEYAVASDIQEIRNSVVGNSFINRSNSSSSMSRSRSSCGCNSGSSARDGGSRVSPGSGSKSSVRNRERGGPLQVGPEPEHGENAQVSPAERELHPPAEGAYAAAAGAGHAPRSEAERFVAGVIAEIMEDREQPVAEAEAQIEGGIEQAEAEEPGELRGEEQDEEREADELAAVPEESKLKVHSQNIGGLNTNIVELLEEFDNAPPDIVALQECFGTCKIKGLGWKLVRHLRPDEHANHGGGTGFLVRAHVLHEVLRPLWFRTDEGIEACWIRVRMDRGWLYVTSVYAPPQKPVANAAAKLREQLGIVYADPECCGILVCGDFNSSWYEESRLHFHGLGGRGGNYRNPGKVWREALTAPVGLLQPRILNDTVPLQSTHTQVISRNRVSRTVIDYMVWAGSSPATNFRIITSNRPHSQLSIHLPASASPILRPPKINWRQLTANADKRKLFQNRVHAGMDQHMSFDEWVDVVQEASLTALGRSKYRLPSKYSEKPWWTPQLSASAQQLKSIGRRIHRNLNKGHHSVVASCKLKLRELKKAFQIALHGAQREYWNQFRSGWDLSRNSLNNVWRFLRGLDRAKKDFPHSRADFETAWEPIFGASPPAGCRETECTAEVESIVWPEWNEDDRISTEELMSCIGKTPTAKSPGMDGFPNEMLKALPADAVEILAKLMTTMLQDPTTIPRGWYRTLVCMIEKVPQPLPLEYRPISLLSNVAKLLERVLHEREKAWKLPLHRHAGGFREFRGTIQQVWLLRVLWDSLKQHNRAGYVIFLDLKKAFDSVPIHIVISKMHNSFPQVPRYAVRHFWHWLRNHSHQLLVGPGTPKELPVNRGVLQGSINSPSIFNMFVNDLSVALENGLGDNLPPAPSIVLDCGAELADLPPILAVDAAEAAEGNGEEVGGGLMAEAEVPGDPEPAIDGNMEAAGDVGLGEGEAFDADLANNVAGQPAQGDISDEEGNDVELDAEEEIRVNSISFADDFAGLSLSLDGLKRITKILEAWSATNGLSFAPHKCKVMRIGTSSQNPATTPVKIDNESVEWVRMFKQLGVKLKVEPKTGKLDISDQIAQITKNFLKPKYSQLEAPYGCGVSVGLHIAQARYVPALLYGSEILALPNTAQSLWDRILRKILQCYKSDSGALMREFTGSRALHEVARVRLLRFVFTLALKSSPPEMRRSLIRVLRAQFSSPTAWVKRAREAFRQAHADGWIVDLPGDLQPHSGTPWHLVYVTATAARSASALLELNKQYKQTKPLAHASVRASTDSGHFTFRFWHGRFNPRTNGVPDDGTSPCLLCAHGHDSPGHLPFCPNATVRMIIDEEYAAFQTHIQLQGDGKQIFKEFVAHPHDHILYEEGEDGPVKDTSKQKEGWKVIGITHRRLWRLRIKKRQEWLIAHGNQAFEVDAEIAEDQEVEGDEGIEGDEGDAGEGSSDSEAEDSYSSDDNSSIISREW